jgi:hypothetical protein
MAEQPCCSASNAQPLTAHDTGGQPRSFVRFDQAPKSWLRLLVDDNRFLDGKSLQILMAASWAVCEAVLQCMGKRRLRVQVRRHVPGLFNHCLCVLGNYFVRFPLI